MYKNNTALLKLLTERGYQVLSLGGPLVSHLISKIESENTDIQFTRVDGDIIDKLIEKDDVNVSKLSKKEEEKIQKMFEEIVDKEKFTVKIQSMSSNESPIIITQSEFMRRMKEQARIIRFKRNVWINA